MNYDEFNQFCNALPATTHVVQWGNADVWKIGGKVFAIGGWGKESQPAFTFKTSSLNYEFLSDLEGYIPAPYFANRGMKWIQQTGTDGHLDEDLKYYVCESYRIVSDSLTKRKQEEITAIVRKQQGS
ncbi:MmcQ/YjbR family DNA-binding protein [Aliivibrio kagoshimensis]|uniref:MmcQ/YjbR family DNA-binding protein n=1 Tax=Aliivibrio kagoshimensis TaxID=2910230 RepID=UPI003D12B9EB